MDKQKLQWHPAFYAGIQIELQQESENLIFENEHQLGTKPKEIDVLIIKKQKDIPIKKNIGRIFRKYNIVEYKSPSDYLSIYNYLSTFSSVNINSVPSPSVLITLIFSLWARMISLVMESPRPVPFLSLPRERSVL